MMIAACLARLIALMVDQDFMVRREGPVSVGGRNWTLLLVFAVLVVVVLSAVATTGLLVYALADLVLGAIRGG